MQTLMKYFLLSALFFTQLLYAQEAKRAKWGKIDTEVLKMETYEYDPEANAIVLSDYGRYDFLQTDRSKYMFERKTRIKILTKSGVDYGDVSIPFWHKNGIEKILKIKGHTFNLDEHGAVVKTPLEKAAIFENELNDDRAEMNFSMPNVKVGSVIEYSYYLVSDAVLQLKPWEFQCEIPTIYTGVDVKMPEGFAVNYRGEQLIAKYQDSPPVNHWSLTYLPAIKYEPYVYRIDDYRCQLNFQWHNYAMSWEDRAVGLLAKTHEFSITKVKHPLVKDEVAALITEGQSDLEKMKTLYYHVSTNFKWNKKYHYFRKQSMKKIVESKEGNSMEATSYLILLLRVAGLEVHPLMVSTKGHGRVDQSYPHVNSFNHVIAYVNINGTLYLLDPTDPQRPYNLLSVQDLNEVGFLVTSPPKWITLENRKPTKKTMNITIDYTQKDVPNYQITHIYQQYFALYYRRTLKNAKDTTAYFTNALDTLLEDYTLDSMKVENVKEFEKPFKTYMELTIPQTDLAENEEFLYLQPHVLHDYAENQFKANTRQFPVDYGTPFESTIRISVKLPEGYEVVDMPKSKSAELGLGIGRFTYQIQKTGDNLVISSKLKMVHSLISAQLYPELKDFYDIIVSKHSEVITLKKL